MATPFPFTTAQVLTAAEMNAIGEKTSYTPTFTNLTLGNGTVTASFFRVQNVVTVSVVVVLGSTSSISGDVMVTLPIARVSVNSLQLATVQYNDPGVQNFTGAVVFSTTLTNAFCRVIGTAGVIGVLSATVPFTWATNDVLRFSAQYEVA